MDKNATILYIPHGGGPLPLLDEAAHLNLNTFLRGFKETIAKPDAIIVISAHWEEPVVSITAQSNPSLLFDYFGFPPETYQYEYPAPGQTELARRIQAMLAQSDIDSRLDQERDFDHGVFIPLMLMYPQADIPCIQISLSDSLDAAFHVQLGNALSALKQENLLILGSGFSFHNLSVMMRGSNAIDEKNQLFETWLAQTCSDENLPESEREQRLIDWAQVAPHARYCHPREEHLLPLQVCYGIGGKVAKTVFQEPVTGYITSAYQW